MTTNDPGPWNYSGQINPLGSGRPAASQPRHDTTSTELRDDTTRYLCAAAHLDRDFATNAVREFLTEPKRAVAPSPGVNAGAVLREAVAARTRRRIRDSILAVLVFIYAILSPISFLMWIPGAVLIAALGIIRDGSRRSARRLVGLLVLGVVAGIIALVLLSQLLLVSLQADLTSTLFGGESSTYSNRYGRPSVTGFLASGAATLAPIIAVLMLLVLLADRLIVWSLLTKSFRRHNWRSAHPGQDTWSGEWQFRRLGHWRFAAMLAQYESTASQSEDNVVVYRGYVPFVGAGYPYKPWSIAIPLEQRDSEKNNSTERDQRRSPFLLKELYQEIENDLKALQNSASLSPSHRLRELRVTEQVIVHSGELLDHVEASADTTEILPHGMSTRPHQRLTRQQLDNRIEHPLEWMRYYRCFQVETWDRDLVISAYLHLGVDARTLYVEWTPCVLGPVIKEYARLDSRPPQLLRPVAEAFMRWLKLPITIFGRIRYAASRMKPLPEVYGMVVPDKYGSQQSLREMAAENEAHNYFQRTDLDRYLLILQGRITPAIGRFLESKGIDVAEFIRRATAVNNTYNYIGGNHISGTVRGNVVQAQDIDGGVNTGPPR